ncbi:ribosome hibernation-promoting factor, HPF/YfiA family [Bermanella sp. R86510]|uniref:ribosome hibernation-promoting factor, HPF/YfiA family n=1 Tax=unclassified Bermanella TaxID=2627862 RepID=UPI0037C63AA9
MQINISGHHVDITDALRDYVHSKVEKLERHFDNITNVQVTLTVEKLIQKAEATVHAAGAELHANADNENMYAAIDGLTDKLDRQLLKHKEKMVNHRHGNSH